MLKVIEAIHHPKGKYVKIKYCMQPTKTPQFVFLLICHNMLKNHINDTLKIKLETTGISGVPIDIYIREK
jgi:predicted GTPase